MDLRSDTVTRPTAAMRAAIAEAEVGDDGWGDDPTVLRLEALAAEMLGHEAAVYVPSGVMANQLGLRAHTVQGDEVLCGEWAHVRTHESGALAGVQYHTLPDLPAGHPAPDDVALALRGPAHHMAGPSLLCLEDTHNIAGGRVTPPDRLKELRAAAGALPVHLDGARIFNAAVALGVDAAAIAENADTVSFCLSKGLGAPVGSMLCGSGDLIDRARQWRALYGGGMRQAGIIAAGGIHALEHHVDRLADDHARAKALAAGIGAAEPDTNIVLLEVGSGDDADRLLDGLRQCGVLATHYPRPGTIRFVTHLDVNDDDIAAAIDAVSACRAS